MKRFNSTMSLGLVLIIILGSLGPVLAEKQPPSTIIISSPQDLYDLADKASFDKWSQGKTVILDASIDLGGRDLTPIPIFSGIFDGRGHTISGISIGAEGSDQGLFRYLEEGGQIRNLNIKGNVLPLGDRTNIGGLVGYNKGLIENCSFTGYLKGKDSIGGIAGLNGNTGIIINSSSKGVIYGETKVGGIVGFNTGSIIDSDNEAKVNTTTDEADFDYKDLNLESINIDTINIAKLTSDSMDIGGIVGLNTGVVRGAENRGTVGYPSVGYNIGGIAGRQSGYMTACVNYGSVYGRKEVAGIVGQMEPHVDTIIPGSKLEDLQREMKLLDSYMGRLTGGIKSTSNLMSENMSRLEKDIDKAREDIRSLVDQTEKLINKDIEEINRINLLALELVSRLNPILDSFNSIMTKMEKATNLLKESLIHIGRAMEGLSDVAQEYEKLSRILDAVNIRMTILMNKMDRVARDLESLISLLERMTNDSNIRSLLDKFIDGEISLEELLEELDFGDLEKIEELIKKFQDGSIDSTELIRLIIEVQGGEILKLLESIVGNLADASRELRIIMNLLNSAGSHMSKIIDSLGGLGKEMKIGLDYLIIAIGIMESAGEDIDSIMKDLGDILDYISKEEPLEFETTEEVYQKTREDLFRSMEDISKSFSLLGSDMNMQTNILVDDFQRLSDQLFKVMNILFTIVDDLSYMDLDPGKKYEDVSGEEIEGATRGKVEGSSNHGNIEGDINVGGIAGAMSIEVEIDPEEDFNLKNRISYNTVYQTRAIILKGENTGDIISKKNNVGGIVGNQDLGYIKDSLSTGTVKSTDGDYIGGIAGLSRGPIVSSYSKTNLEGGNYIGGIVGFGREIRSCYSLVNIEKLRAYGGAIAGRLEKDGRVEENYFVSKNLRGIDGISYGDKAEPIAYEKLIGIKGIPFIFKEFKLEFWAEDKLIDTIDFNYGDSIEEQALPRLVEKEGHYGKWPELNLKDLLFDRRVYAEYIPYVELLESKEKRNQVLSIFLVEGRFTEDDFIGVRTGDLAPLDGEDFVERWIVDIPEDGEESHRIRYYPQGKNKNLRIYSLSNGKWQRVKSKWEGKYLVFDSQGPTVDIGVVEGRSTIIKDTILFIIVALITMIIGYTVYRMKKKKHEA